jgi:hypothetical protein
MKSIFLRASGSFGAVLLLFGIIGWLIAGAGALLWASYFQMILGLALIGTYLWFFAKEGLKRVSSNQESIYGVMGGLLFAFVLAGLNVAAHSEFGERRFDTTSQKIHSLSDESRQILRNIEVPIEVKSFVVHPQIKPQIKRLMDRYRSENPLIQFEEIDPNIDPRILQRFQATENQVVIHNPERDSSALLSVDQFNEQGMSMAFYRVAAGDTPVVYFLQGNGEADLQDEGASGLLVAKHLMEREGYQVRPLFLAESLQIPEDAEALVLWGPSKTSPPLYQELLAPYLKNGGRLILGLNPVYNSRLDRLLPTGLEEILKSYGVEVPKAFVAQEIRNRDGQSQYLWQAFGVKFSQHPITQVFDETENVFFQFNFGFPLRFNSKDDNLQSVSLVSTNAQTRLITDIASLLRGNLVVTNEAGPFDLVRIVERNEEGQLLVFGNSSFLSTAEIDRNYHGDLFLNGLDHLTQRERTQFIRPRFFKSSTLEMTESQKSGVQFASLFLFPQLIILFGLGVWTFRRARR